jgi:hypothetical protein
MNPLHNSGFSFGAIASTEVEDRGEKLLFPTHPDRRWPEFV